ncbi:hypothetical protein [Helcococcus kunzii]|uniref:Uncharacterized protein n=1 Tax=Helcococcus kunzii ATCC 51366 TaxID=883114 RepID=H3NPG6_9FIRM|nr:hypothetical protein [Helcococcus kunzii]EHR33479.1 hypothetical protein HMPREF9709_01227 [Helcococcus kunzii ATCC 51366]
MKFGIRKPSLKKSFKARTTGKLNRHIKKSINPFYGKKGMGFLNNPKKSMYNKVYNKTSSSFFDIFKSSNNNSHGILWWILIGWWYKLILFIFYIVFIAWWKIPLNFFKSKK